MTTTQQPHVKDLDGMILWVMSEFGLQTEKIVNPKGVIEIIVKIPQPNGGEATKDLTYRIITSDGAFNGSVFGPDPQNHYTSPADRAVMVIDDALGRLGYKINQHFSPYVEYKRWNYATILYVFFLRFNK